jgi:putative phosphoesterase
MRALRSIAPVVAVRGNCDLEPWADILPVRAELELGGVRIAVGHIASRTERARLESERGNRPMVVVSGHSHIASLEQHGAVLYLNPGSAGARRFGRPRTVARLDIWPPPTGEPGGLPRVTAQLLSAEDD